MNFATVSRAVHMPLCATPVMDLIAAQRSLNKNKLGEAHLQVLESSFLSVDGYSYDDSLFSDPESFNLFCDTLDEMGWVSGCENAMFSIGIVDPQVPLVRMEFEVVKDGKRKILSFDVDLDQDRRIVVTPELLKQTLSLKDNRQI